MDRRNENSSVHQCCDEVNVVVKMTVEAINEVLIPHNVIPIIGDRTCLFRSLSYLVFDTQVLCREIRETVVTYVVEHWEEFSISSQDANGDNY